MEFLVSDESLYFLNTPVKCYMCPFLIKKKDPHLLIFLTFDMLLIRNFMFDFISTGALLMEK